MLDVGDAVGRECHPEQPDKSDSYGDIDQRTGNGDHEFLAGPVGHALDVGDAADREKGYVAGVDSIAPCSENVAELMGEHAGKHCQNEQHRLDRLALAAGEAGSDAVPGNKEKKGDVHTHVRAGDPTQGKGPCHDFHLSFARSNMRLH